MDFLELVKARQSDRAYDKNRPVEPEKLERILEAARLAPSVTAWELTPLVEAQVDLYRARAALLLMEVSEGEERKAHRHETIHRLLSCKEKGGRSVLVPLAEESLAALPAEAEEREEV